MWRSFGWVLVLVAGGCRDASPMMPGDPDTGDASNGTVAATTTTRGADTSEASSVADFVAAPDGGAPLQCELYADNCPAGEKCMPYARDGGSRQDATRCVPLVDAPLGLDDACTVEEWVASGLDDCDRGLFCVVYDPVELTGRCLAMCVVEPDEPDLGCSDPVARCVGTPDTLPRLCAADCDPIDNDCTDDRGCYRVGDHFVCLDDVSGPGGDFGDPCLFTNQCDTGMLCADPPEFDGCPHPDGCCTPLCDTREPDASASCAGAPAHMCVPLFDPGEGSPLLDWVGACVVPTEGGP